MRYVQFVKAKWFLFAAGLVLGIIIIFGARFVAYKPDTVHYHANFALYIDGQRQQFRGIQYYAETASCSVNSAMVPAERAHLHDNVNDVVHVEDHAVTWSQFFLNLNWYVGPDFIESPDRTMFKESGDTKLHIILNGQDYTDFGGIANTVIKDQDKLLLSYGNETRGVVQQQYKAVPSTARHYDTTPDPETCSGTRGTMMGDRFKHMF